MPIGRAGHLSLRRRSGTVLCAGSQWRTGRAMNSAQALRVARQTWFMVRGPRAEMLRQLSDAIGRVATPHPVRVAVDGRPASGKTTLANELRDRLSARGRHVIRATIDEFMYPKAVRYRRGVDSPDGCYEDSFDFTALHRALLDPLGPGGGRMFQEAAYDRQADRTMPLRMDSIAPLDAILIFDGVFLMRPELNHSWDLRILVSTSFEETLNRARHRDADSLGSIERVEERFRTRYLPSQAHYFDTVKPREVADLIVENDDVECPAWAVKYC